MNMRPQLLDALLDNTEDGVLAFDPECRYTAWNAAMERISGLPAAEVIGQHAFSLFPVLLETGEDEFFRAALAGRPVTSHDRRYTIPATGRMGFFEGRYRPVRNQAGDVIGGMAIIRDVTADRQLRQHEESRLLHYRILQSMREGVSVTDERGVIVYTNPAEDEMFGYAPGELIGQHVTVQNAYPAEENARIVASVIETLKQTGVWVGEWLNRRKDGSVFRTRAQITAVDTGGKQQWVCVQEDVTRERDTQEALRQSAEQLSLALEASRLGPWQWDSATDMVTFSDRAAEIFGVLPGPVMTWTRMRELLHAEDREHARLAVERSIAERSDYDVEYRVIRPQGEECWVAAKGRATYDSEGRVVRMLGVVQDITARKRSEQALVDETRVIETINRIGRLLAGELDRQKLLQALTDAATQISDAQFGSFFYNVTNEKGESYMLYTLSGAAPQAFAGFPMPRNTAIFAPTFKGEGIVRLDDVTQDPRYGKNPPHHGMPTGHLPVRSYLAVPVVSRTGSVLGGLFFGHGRPGIFTARHERILAGIAAQAAVALDNARLYEEAQTRALALDEANRRKDQFLAMLAHELRNPLAAIRSALELLLSQLSASRPFEVVQRQTAVLTQMVDDLLDVSRITRGLIQLKRERVDVAELVRHAVDVMRPLIESRRHTLTVRLPQNASAVSGDPVRLEQVLVNLLANAAKYTEPGGRIAVEVDLVGPDVFLRVSDNGIGIELEMQQRVFELFEQVDRSLDRAQGGLGIGLTIARSLVEQHGGGIEVQSGGRGQGSTFVVHLPLAPEEAVPASPQQPRPARPSTKRVLVVDDHADSGEMLSALLESWGHHVTYVQDGSRALERAAREPFDVILLDIGLPGMNGYEVALQLRRMDNAQRCRLIAVTGYGEQPDRTRSRDAGFDEHLVKPVDPSLLRSSLDKVSEARGRRS